MEFVEAVNPHYAFPIVGVIVCCLLVFAFGFKSPGQPPSFDLADEERKAIKKRKGKENQKVKSQQNGKVTSAVSSKSETSPHIPKTKGTADKPGNKYDQKQSNKKSRSQQVATHVSSADRSKSKVVQSEDGNEDGWVQLISKKERKNRKKDDVAPSSTDATKAVTDMESYLLVSENPKKSAKPQEEVIQANEKKVNDTSDNAAEKESSEDAKVTPKIQKAPKTKKGKREEVNVEFDSMKEIPSPETSDLPVENGISSESKAYSSVSDSSAVVTEPHTDELLQVHEMAVVEVCEEEVKSKTKKKKSKKKNQETAAVEDMKTEINNVHAQELDKVEQQTISKTEITVEPKLIDVESQDSEVKKADESGGLVSAPGSNVVFDELKDFCPEEKPQKKKKKVRREH